MRDEFDPQTVIAVTSSHFEDCLPPDVEGFSLYVIPEIIKYYLQSMMRRPMAHVNLGHKAPRCATDMRYEITVLLGTCIVVLQGYSMRHCEEQVYELNLALNEYDDYLLNNPQGEIIVVDKICTIIYELLFNDPIIQAVIRDIDIYTHVDIVKANGVHKFILSNKGV